MATAPQKLPACSRLLGEDEVVHYLRDALEWARLEDSEANTPLDAADPDPEARWLDSEERRQGKAEAARHRELLRSILPGDKVWLTADPSSHPEAGYGVPCLVVVRGRAVIIRYRLGDDSGPEWGSPVLPSTKRMTRDEAIGIASEWVRARYPIVPAIAQVMEFSDHAIDELLRPTGRSISPEDRRRLAGRWWVTFACSWDTDELGMPTSLRVVVDDETGRAELAQ